MNLVLEILRKFVHLPARVARKINQRRKQRDCLAGKGACLHPESRIWNFQNRKNAIVIGKQCHIRGQLVVLGHGGTIRMGDACYIGEDSRIWSAASITIGDRVLIAHGVNIHDNNSHSLSASSRHEHFMQVISTGHPDVLEDVSSAPIVIEDDAWIGFNATVLKGVTIGRGAVVAAASVVTKDVAAYTIVAGNPAQVVGTARP